MASVEQPQQGRPLAIRIRCVCGTYLSSLQDEIPVFGHKSPDRSWIGLFLHVLLSRSLLGPPASPYSFSHTVQDNNSYRRIILHLHIVLSFTPFLSDISWYPLHPTLVTVNALTRQRTDRCNPRRSPALFPYFQQIQPVR
jgi:hypothetical protein